VDGKTVAEIGKGLVILLGIGPEDALEVAEQMADKIATLRIFEDENEKMNLSALDVSAEAIVVSQFTLYADTRKGRRPSFIDAAPPALAEPLVESFAHMLTDRGLPAQTGVFGAHMEVALVNDGPVTIVIEY
jgi:D-tyrosyl-tRNA(Tyr) deacylase